MWTVWLWSSSTTSLRHCCMVFTVSFFHETFEYFKLNVCWKRTRPQCMRKFLIELYWTYLFFSVHKWAAKCQWWYVMRGLGLDWANTKENFNCTRNCMNFRRKCSEFFFLDGLGNSNSKMRSNSKRSENSRWMCAETKKKRDWNEQQIFFSVWQKQSIWLIQWHEWRIQNIKMWR